MGRRSRVPRPRGDGPAHIPTLGRIIQCSPPARGWTDGGSAITGYHVVFPARAGMDRQLDGRRAGQLCVPRPRGDGPDIEDADGNDIACSPPARGWTSRLVVVDVEEAVFPARAGMDRPETHAGAWILRVPRPRGDGPFHLASSGWTCVCSPPARGWTVVGLQSVGLVNVFPARAGMDRFPSCSAVFGPSVPRPRGDGPEMVTLRQLPESCSPPARGWTDVGRFAGGVTDVFPARAGMDRRGSAAGRRGSSVPRPRGDGPSG